MTDPVAIARAEGREPDYYDYLRAFTQTAKKIHEVADELRAMQDCCPTWGKPRKTLLNAAGGGRG